jgi:glutamine amidotransferase
MIAVVDAGIGNLRSISNALRQLGCEFRVAGSPDELADANGLILPGVGAFGDAMRRIEERGFRQPLIEGADRGVPVLGLCVGMQLLARVGHEFGEHEGLNLIDGAVTRVEPGPGLRVPHMGWNTVEARGGRLLAGLSDPTFYFVHSYSFHPGDPAVVTGVTDHGGEIVACVERDNVFGAQFHPEKSQRDGAQLLRNFMSICAKTATSWG